MHSIEIDCFLRQPNVSCPNHCPSKCNRAQRPGPIPSSHLPIFVETRGQCTVCSQAGKKSRTFVTCSLRDVALCLQKERNCLQFHSEASSNP